jgi:hypothetical protein
MRLWVRPNLWRSNAEKLKRGLTKSPLTPTDFQAPSRAYLTGQYPTCFPKHTTASPANLIPRSFYATMPPREHRHRSKSLLTRKDNSSRCPGRQNSLRVRLALPLSYAPPWGNTQKTWDAPRRFEVFAYPAVTVFGSSFQGILLTRHLSHRGPATPGGQVPPV